jgi:hypothetical protein
VDATTDRRDHRCPRGQLVRAEMLRHRVAGRMPILNVVVPPFDPADEWLD